MSKTPICLLHGAWHWGGCYQKLATLLASAGHPVITPDLASHGYSPIPWQSIRSMADYTAPVQAALAQSPEPVILLGHSLGGSSLAYLAQTMPEKIKSIVYLAAFMVPPGKTINDYSRSYATNPLSASFFKLISPTSDKSGLCLDLSQPDLLREAFYGQCTAHDIDIARRNAIPINSRVPMFFASESLSSLPRHYITCAQDHAIPLTTQLQMIAESPGTIVHGLESDHSPFFSAPAALAAILAHIAAS